MRNFKSKSDLKNTLQIEISIRNQSNADAKIIDGCGQVWAISWPTNRTSRNLAYTMYKAEIFLLAKCIDVYLIFDRYCKFSFIGITWIQKTTNLSNTRILSLNAPLPSREVIMTSSTNKTQLIHVILQYLVDMLSVNHYRSRFVLTFSETTPIQIQNGEVLLRDDINSSHKEADINILM